jgi:two-component system, NarL family, nitrate/nitrite response regulator NarL
MDPARAPSAFSQPVKQLLLVEDNPLFVEQITEAVARLGEDWLVQDFAEGITARATVLTAPKPFDLALIDLGLPDISGIEVIQTCRERFPDMPIVVISVIASEAGVLGAIQAGANGYILKDESIEEIEDGIRQVLQGVYPLSPRLARYLFKRLAHPTTAPSKSLDIRLTPREQETLQHLAQGYRYEQVAERMGVTLSTVQSNVRSLYRKLNVHSQVQAIAKARDSHLL